MCNTPNMLQAAQAVAQAAPADAFAGRLVELASNATTGLMISIGHRTHLFEALKERPATSIELAERAKLNERYVREWLGALATSGIVVLDAASRLALTDTDLRMAVIGLGKLGAGELGYASDLDVMVVFDPPDARDEAVAAVERIVTRGDDRSPVWLDLVTPNGAAVPHAVICDSAGRLRLAA